METKHRRENLTLSFFLIKPEALEYEKHILNYIDDKSKLRVVDRRKIVLSRNDIEQIYIDDHGSALMKAIEAHLVGETVIVGVLKGENAVAIFQEICGYHYDPKYCDLETLRYKFGSHRSVNYENIPYFLNGIHKASSTEIDSVLEWYRNRFDVKKEELLSHA